MKKILLLLFIHTTLNMLTKNNILISKYSKKHKLQNGGWIRDFYNLFSIIH